MTNRSVRHSGRNQAMECCKFIASFFVIFNHASFPGTLGSILNCLCSFAVPTFFMISGYFNYQASPEQIVRRAKHIVKLLLLGTLLHLLWGCISTELSGGSTIAYLRAAIPDPDEIMKWIILHIHPYAGHYWYLNALIACYSVFYVFTVFSGKERTSYKAFYSLCFYLLTITFAFDTIAAAAGNSTTGLVARTGWFVGLPMFGIGLFIREYQERIFSAFHPGTAKLCLVICFGAALTILQWSCAEIGVIPFGTLIGVVALMLLLVSHPVMISKPGVLSRLVLELGPLSTWIYLIHLVFVLFYNEVLHEPCTALWGAREPYLFPIVVAVISLIAAIVCNALSHVCKRFSRK